MHEFMLRVTPETQERPEFTRVRLTGSVVYAATDRIKQNKWLEILCIFPDPRKRINQIGTILPSHQEGFESAQTNIATSLGEKWRFAKENWEPLLSELYRDWESTPQGRESEDKRSDLMNLIEGRRVRSALGRDPTGVVDVMDTWLFSEEERRQYLVVTSSDISEAAAYNTMLPAYEMEGGRLISRNISYVDWENELGYTPQKLADIRSRNVTVHPDFANPITLDKFKNSADARGLRAVRDNLRLRGRP